MEILKELLLKTFNKRLERLEERTSQQLKDLQFTGESFIKQGKMLDKMACIKIVDETQSKRKPKEDNKRDMSPNVVKNNGHVNKDKDKEDNKSEAKEKMRTHTPTFNQTRNRDRSKTPIGNSNANCISTLRSATKTSVEMMTPYHSKKRSFNGKSFSALRNKTPDKLDKKLIQVNKKKDNKEIKDKTLTTTPSETNNKKVVKKFNNNTNSNNSNTNTKSVIEPITNIKLEELNTKGPNKDKEEINTSTEHTKIISDIISSSPIIPSDPLNEIKLQSPIEKPIPKPIIVYEKFDIYKFIKENYNKSVFESITIFLYPNDKINLFTTMKCFKYHLGQAIQEKKKQFDEKFYITSSSTITDKINELRFKYKAEQLTGDIVPFQISRGGIKAIQLLNEELYNRVFHQTELNPPLNEIILVYRIFFQLLNNNELSSISNDNEFWKNASEYILANNNGLTGAFFANKANDFVFTSENINKVVSLLHGKLDHIKPTFYSKICGTTGLLIFLIKDALEYSGIQFFEKKTNLVLLYNRLSDLNKIHERVMGYIEYLKQ